MPPHGAANAFWKSFKVEWADNNCINLPNASKDKNSNTLLGGITTNLFDDIAITIVQVGTAILMFSTKLPLIDGDCTLGKYLMGIG
jgi:hypothetical protein